MQILVPIEQVEQGWGIELLALVVHNKFGWEGVPQMWEFSPCIIVSSMTRPDPAVVVQVVHRKLLLQSGTSF